MRCFAFARRLCAPAILCAALIAASSATADFGQSGAKFTGPNETGAGNFGVLAISGDGTTAVVGGPADNNFAGAVWFFTRSGDTWSLQGAKVTPPTGSTFNSLFGSAVALSYDGNTALVGAKSDGSSNGATWVFTRSNGVWSVQGSKLVGSGGQDGPRQGSAVALSADGNIAAIGGPVDSANAGAVWIFTRSGTTWTQQGSKLVGTGNTGSAQQGAAVALSADGEILLSGGPTDGGSAGATWFFARSGTTWTQQGNKLVGSSGTNARQGTSVALSSDGSTAAIGGPLDAAQTGATWIFTRSGSAWTQQGSKLVGMGGSNQMNGISQGSAVALAADGNTLISGAPNDANVGAFWVFTRSGTTWTQQGNKLTGSSGNGAQQGGALALSADGNVMLESGRTDTGGVGAVWAFSQPVNPTTIVSAVLPTSRSVQVGNPATAFSTIINSGGNTGFNCALSIANSVAGSFLYRTTDPQTNAVTGVHNFPVTLAPGASQSFVFAITPTSAFSATDIPIVAKCSNSDAAVVTSGLNTLLLSASNTPVADIIAVSATTTNDGVLVIPGTTGTGAFAVASFNVGSTSSITVSADTNGVLLPLTFRICQTDPSTAACTTPLNAATVTTTLNANTGATFSVFATASGTIADQPVAFDPANNRIFVRFKDSSGETRGATSVAVKTQ